MSPFLYGRRSDRRLINYDKLGAVVKRVNSILSLAHAGHPPLVFTQKSILSSTTSDATSSSSSSVSSKDSTPYSFDFEGNTFREQVSIMRATDILLTVHGAAETNIAWMHPCSTVLEVSEMRLHLYIIHTLYLLYKIYLNYTLSAGLPVGLPDGLLCPPGHNYR